MVLMAECQSLRDFLDGGGELVELVDIPCLAMIAEVAVIDRAVMDPDRLRRQAVQDRWAGTEVLSGRPEVPFGSGAETDPQEELALARMYLWSAEVALDDALAARFIAALPSDIRTAAEADRDGRLIAVEAQRRRLSNLDLAYDTQRRVDVTATTSSGRTTDTGSFRPWSIQVEPAAGDVDVGVVDEPAVAGRVPAGSGGVDEQRREPLHPPLGGDVLDE